MKPADFSIGDGVVTHWSLALLDPARPLLEQLDELKEDLAQIHYAKRDRYLDVGWYPEFSTVGSFLVTVVENQNWDEPIFKEASRTIADLQAVVSRAAEAAAK